jgi:hypothetical protein
MASNRIQSFCKGYYRTLASCRSEFVTADAAGELKETRGERTVKKKDELSRKLSELEKRFARSGLRLSDGSSKVKAMAFVGGVRKRNNLPPDAPSS